MNKHLDQIHSEGYVAGEHGAPRDHNPHSLGSGEWYHWDQGWLEADADWRKPLSDNGGGFIEFLAWVIMLVILAGVATLIWKAVSWVFSFV